MAGGKNARRDNANGFTREATDNPRRERGQGKHGDDGRRAGISERLAGAEV